MIQETTEKKSGYTEDMRPVEIGSRLDSTSASIPLVDDA
jgi:hypothetical protein